MSKINDGSRPARDERELRDAQFAMRLSLAFGVAMLLRKSTAHWCWF
ncbi:MAG: hypothetical protein ACLPY1_18910 [Terracidiphilus sp.]